MHECPTYGAFREANHQVYFCWLYRVTMVDTHLGWVDSDLWSSSGWWAASAATYCPTEG